MARAILGIGAAAWSIGFVAAVVVAIVGIDRLLSLLPPLQIDADAVRGAVTAVAAGLAVAAALHLAVLAGLRRGQRRAWSAAILLAGLLAATFVALAAAAFTSAVTQPASVVQLVVAGSAALVAAIGYGLATVLLVGELRSRATG